MNELNARIYLKHLTLPDACICRTWPTHLPAFQISAPHIHATALELLAPTIIRGRRKKAGQAGGAAGAPMLRVLDPDVGR